MFVHRQYNDGFRCWMSVLSSVSYFEAASLLFWSWPPKSSRYGFVVSGAYFLETSWLRLLRQRPLKSCISLKILLLLAFNGFTTMITSYILLLVHFLRILSGVVCCRYTRFIARFSYAHGSARRHPHPCYPNDARPSIVSAKTVHLVSVIEIVRSRWYILSTKLRNGFSHDNRGALCVTSLGSLSRACRGPVRVHPYWKKCQSLGVS